MATKKRKLENNKIEPKIKIKIEKPEEEEQQEIEEEKEESEQEQTQTLGSAAETTLTLTNHESEDSEPIEDLLEPYSKEQLASFLSEAANSHPDVLNRIKTLVDVDPVHRKIFVHGLGWDTTAETLTNFFSKYGEIEDCKAVVDKISGKSKGYAFILFKHRSGARKALKEPQKFIGGRMTACQLASAGPVPPPAQAGPPASEYTQRKIYVSNVSADIDPQKLLSFFSKYGEILEGPLGLDKHTGKPKGFTLFVYKAIESARKALEEPHKSFEGHILHCQKAVDGPKTGKMNYQSSESNSVRDGSVGGGYAIASPAGVPYNQVGAVAEPVPQLDPVQVQALSALLNPAILSNPAALTTLLGVNSSVQPVNNTGYGMQAGYGNQLIGNNISPGVYGNQAGGSSGYSNYQTGQTNSNYQMGQTNARRPHQGTSYMGGKPYMGH